MSKSRSETEIYTPSNGPTVIATSSRFFHGVYVSVYVRSGSIFENSQNNGISHFIEHMLFQGTEKYPTNKDLSSEIRKCGITFPAYTRRQHTLYSLKCHPNELPKALEILSQTLLHPQFREKDILLEKKIITEENSDYDADTQEQSMKETSDLLFKDSPLFLEPLGTHQNITRLSKTEITAYHKKYYFPQNMIISVTGNISTEKVKNQISKLFTNSEAKEKITYPSIALQKKGFRKHIISDQQEKRSTLVWTFCALHADTKDDNFLWTVEDLVRYKLEKELRQETGLVYTISLSRTPYSDFDIIDIYISCSSKSIDEVLERFEKIITHLELTDAELLEPIKRAENSLLYLWDKPQEMNEYLALELLYQREHGACTLEKRIDDLHKITILDVITTARVIFAKDNSVLFVWK